VKEKHTLDEHSNVMYRGIPRYNTALPIDVQFQQQHATLVDVA